MMIRRTLVIGYGLAAYLPDSTVGLVVDAMRRASRSPAWPREMGYGQPGEDRTEVDAVDPTRRSRLPVAALDGAALRAKVRTASGALARYWGGRTGRFPWLSGCARPRCALVVALSTVW